MNEKQLSAWKNVRNAGTTSLVVGILNIVGVAVLLILGLIFSIGSFSIPSDSGGEPVSSIVFGVMFIVFALILLVLAIFQIIAGNKLRKPVANPKGWLIFTIVMGALGISSITGILLLIFGIIGLTSYHDIEGTQPPAQL